MTHGNSNQNHNSNRKFCEVLQKGFNSTYHNCTVEQSENKNGQRKNLPHKSKFKKLET